MFRRKGKKVICICMLLSFFSMSVVANIVSNKIDHQLRSTNRTTIIVDAKGYGDCTTIQCALDLCHDGDRIEVYSGYYPEYVNRSDRVQITIQGHPGEYKNGSDDYRPIVDGCRITSVFTFLNMQNLKMDGFYICNSSLNGNNVGIYLRDCVSCIINNNTVNNSEYGIVCDSCDHGNCQITKNIINNTIWSGIYMSSSSEDFITNNHIHNSGYNAITLVNCRYNLIYYNDLSSNMKDGIKIISDPPFTFQIGFNQILSNNIVGNGQECEQEFSFLNQWLGNWWGKPMGMKIIFCFPPIIDRHPTPVPYNITMWPNY